VRAVAGAAVAVFLAIAALFLPFGQPGASTARAAVVNCVVPPFGYHCASLIFKLGGNGIGELATVDSTFHTTNGLITCSREGEVMSGTCSHAYTVKDGGSVTIYYKLVASTGSKVCNGINCTFGSSASVAIMLSTTTTISNWHFELQAPVTVQVAKSGTGSGTVTSTPSGIDCGSTCSLQFAAGLPVALTASAAADSSFVGWSLPACSGPSSTCAFSPTSDTLISATFSKNATPAPTPAPTQNPTPTPKATVTPDSSHPGATPASGSTAGPTAPSTTTAPGSSVAASAASSAADTSAPTILPGAASSPEATAAPSPVGSASVSGDNTLVLVLAILGAGVIIAVGLVVGLRRRPTA
jgi:hypothetical protein